MTKKYPILLNISRSKSRQGRKFGQLVERKIRNFLENHTQTVVERLVSGSFLKKSKFNIFLNQQFELL